MTTPATDLDELEALARREHRVVVPVRPTTLLALIARVRAAEGALAGIERERCAKAAEAYAGQFPAYPEFDQLHNAAIDVAKAIRALPTPPEPLT